MDRKRYEIIENKESIVLRGRNKKNLFISSEGKDEQKTNLIK